MPDAALIFPPTFDNRYRGRVIALWAFAALTVMTLWRSLHHILAADGGAQSIASITLDRFSPGASDTVITMFAYWGISQLIVGLFYLLALWRYRSMIPLLLALFTLEYALRFSAQFFKPGVEKLATAPGEIGNIVFLVLGPILFLLSIMPPRRQ